ncbi:MAG: hypothetical protein D6816_04830 [Bacteroidetes bacterium]|nr:MAG: hypothetical protein D6816_04830 [Bacteroidota bacterium]
MIVTNSMLQAFKACKKRGVLFAKGYKPKMQTPQANVGSIVHKCIELDQEHPVLLAANNIDAAVSLTCYYAAKEFLSKNKYYLRSKEVKSEVLIETSVGKHTFKGKVDILLDHAILDIKTVHWMGAPRKNTPLELYALVNTQLKRYVWALNRMGHEIFAGGLLFIVKPGKSMRNGETIWEYAERNYKDVRVELSYVDFLWEDMGKVGEEIERLADELEEYMKKEMGCIEENHDSCLVKWPCDYYKLCFFDNDLGDYVKASPTWELS